MACFVSPLAAALVSVRDELERHGYEFAVVGGLAVSARTEPRFTRDVDLAVAVDDDAQAERLVRLLLPLGYRLLASVEQEATGRLATLRLVTPESNERGVVVDLLFASSGIEPEMVARAELLELFPGVRVPVARTEHLLALKVLSREDSRRPQDRQDLRSLLLVADQTVRDAAGEALRLIERRGFHRDRNLTQLFAQALAELE